MEACQFIVLVLCYSVQPPVTIFSVYDTIWTIYTIPMKRLTAFSHLGSGMLCYDKSIVPSFRKMRKVKA
jgi:hypothetical protein